MPAARKRRASRYRKPQDAAERLAVPLSAGQIRAAVRLHDRLDVWKTARTARRRLAKVFPGFSEEECLIKAIFINSLYATRILAITRMAAHIHRVMSGSRRARRDIRLVDRIAGLKGPVTKDSGPRYLSFASKFAHVFVDSETFPIFDKYANRMLRYHLGRGKGWTDEKHPYRAHCRNFWRVQTLSGWRGSIGDLDHYLWIAGQYRAFMKKRKKAKINGELRTLFESRSRGVQKQLKALRANAF